MSHLLYINGDSFLHESIEANSSLAKRFIQMQIQVSLAIPTGERERERERFILEEHRPRQQSIAIVFCCRVLVVDEALHVFQWVERRGEERRWWRRVFTAVRGIRVDLGELRRGRRMRNSGVMIAVTRRTPVLLLLFEQQAFVASTIEQRFQSVPEHRDANGKQRHDQQSRAEHEQVAKIARQGRRRERTVDVPESNETLDLLRR